MHDRIKYSLELVHNLHSARYIQKLSLSHPMLPFCIHTITNTHTNTHTCYNCTAVGWRTSGNPICDGCCTFCCFLLNSIYWRETVNWVSSWVSVRDRSGVQFDTATVCFMTKNCCIAREMWKAVCVWSVIGMLHSISRIIRRTAFLQTFRNTQSIPQFILCATGTNRPKLSKSTHLSISALQKQIYLWQLFKDNDRSRQCLIGNIAGRTCL
jgi:hypothetical protein